MKNSNRFFADLLTAVLVSLAVAPVSCNKISSEKLQGTLSWNYSNHFPTRAVLDLPDTDAFILTVMNSSGETLYEGNYGDSPESLLVEPGSYTVKVVSALFEAPAFSAPQFGDEEVVVVQAGSTARALLQCLQLNSGLRFRFGSDFLEAYPDGELSVTASDGSLTYGLSEKRTGYFNPGLVSVFLNDGTEKTQLMTRYLEPCQILTMGMTSSSSGGGESEQQNGLSISIDTSRLWSNDEYVIGSGQGEASGTSRSSAYGIAAAKAHIGETGVWVCGYVVGGDLSSTQTGIVLVPPFSSMTNVAIASRSSVTDKSSCLSIQLTKGDIRTALNLVDHPELLGTKIYVKGDLVDAYYGIPGIQNVTECYVD